MAFFDWRELIWNDSNFNLWTFLDSFMNYRRKNLEKTRIQNKKLFKFRIDENCLRDFRIALWSTKTYCIIHIRQVARLLWMKVERWYHSRSLWIVLKTSGWGLIFQKIKLKKCQVVFNEWAPSPLQKSCTLSYPLLPNNCASSIWYREPWVFCIKISTGRS